MPLQDANTENGCMWFSPGSHRLGVLPHRSPDNDPRVHALECVGAFNAEAAIACPIPAGAATAHLGRTLHFAGPNRSDGPRCAYIFTFEVPSERPRERRRFEWNHGKQPANMLRKRRWQRRGGILVEASRKLRAGVPWRRAASRLWLELRRALRRCGI
jgi:ectoine hydroxylase-related dioxygenase (phytanoyl-CoA dioxygenase family)